MDTTRAKSDPEGMSFSVEVEKLYKGETLSEETLKSICLACREILNEEKSGEYLPIFRGNYIRKSLYTDIGTKKSCGIISYIKFDFQYLVRLV